jgi:uncharacterized protein
MKKLGQVIFLLIIYLVVVKLPLLLETTGSSETTVTIAFIIVRILLILWSLYLIKKFAVRDAGLSPFYSRYPILSFIVLAWAIYLMYQVYESFPANILLSQFTILLFLNTLCIGFAEELFLRSFMQNHLMQQNPTTSKLKVILITSLLFGLAHYSNLLEKGFLVISLQVVVAVALGFLFGCLLFKTKNIYPIALVHAFIDFGSLMDQKFKGSATENSELTTQHVMVHLILAIIIMGIGLLVLRWPFKKSLPSKSSSAITS